MQETAAGLGGGREKTITRIRFGRVEGPKAYRLNAPCTGRAIDTLPCPLDLVSIARVNTKLVRRDLFVTIAGRHDPDFPAAGAQLTRDGMPDAAFIREQRYDSRGRIVGRRCGCDRPRHLIDRVGRSRGARLRGRRDPVSL